MNRWRFYVVKDWAYGAIQVHIYQKHENGDYSIVQPFTAKREPREEGVPLESPASAMSLSPEEIQALVDELAKNGFVADRKPDDVTAIHAHLQDMRAITFGKLNIEKP